MTPLSARTWWLVSVLGPLTLFAIWGVARIPFHPDESSWLYMSRDFETLLTQPWQLAWNPERESDPDQNYRELNAPLTPYLLGLARWLVGVPASAVAVDWDWTKTWGENQLRGALPSPALLWSARLIITLLLPVSVAFLYQTARRVGGELAGFSAALLLGLNSLILLHNRRAMAEGALTLGVTLSLWSLLEAGRRPWLTGASLALALSAKQSAAALFPVGVLAVIWFPVGANRFGRTTVFHLAQFVGSFGLVFFLLNPLLWRQPLNASRAMLHARQVLLGEQVAAIESVNPGFALNGLGERLAAQVAHAFMTPPAFEELANYLSSTASAKAAYLAVPGHTLFRGIMGGGLLVILTLFGLSLAGLQALGRWRWHSSVPFGKPRLPSESSYPEGQPRPARPRFKSPKVSLADFAMVAANLFTRQRWLILLLLATFSQSAFLIAAVPLPFQRYSLPLLPFICLWAGYGLGQIGLTFVSRRPR